MGIAVKTGILAKGWGFFDIMHMDRRVARIYENGKCTINYKSFMPYNLYLEANDDIDTRVQNLTNFFAWCSSRVLTLDRKHAKEIMNSIGAVQSPTDRDRAMIAISYRALTLMDVFWVRTKDDKKTFSEISLFNHSLSDAFVDVSLRGKNLTLENAELIPEQDPAADIGTPGVAPKAWIRREDEFYLLKDGNERDVDSELLASEITNCFDIDHVSYTEYIFNGTRTSKCKIITSEQRSIVPMEFIEIYCVNHDMNRMDFILKKDAYSYYMMNIIDYLIGNTDRHWGNWGFLVDNKNNKLLKLHSLMDYNKAFLSYDNISGARCQTSAEPKSQQQAAEEAVKAIGLNQIKEIDSSWFDDEKTKEMFFKRLDFLKSIKKQKNNKTASYEIQCIRGSLYIPHNFRCAVLGYVNFAYKK